MILSRSPAEPFEVTFARAIHADLSMMRPVLNPERWAERYEEAMIALALLGRWGEPPSLLLEKWTQHRPFIYEAPTGNDLRRIDDWLHSCVRMILQIAREQLPSPA